MHRVGMFDFPIFLFFSFSSLFGGVFDEISGPIRPSKLICTIISRNFHHNIPTYYHINDMIFALPLAGGKCPKDKPASSQAVLFSGLLLSDLPNSAYLNVWHAVDVHTPGRILNKPPLPRIFRGRSWRGSVLAWERDSVEFFVTIFIITSATGYRDIPIIRTDRLSSTCELEWLRL